MKRRKISKKLAMTAALVTTLLGAGSAYAAYNVVAGPKADGTGVTPHGWTLTPAGKQVNLGNFPMNAAMSPDHKYLVISNDGQGTQSLQVVDTTSHKVIQTIPYDSPNSLYFGIAFSPDGKTVYASTGGQNKIRVYSFDNGTLTEKTSLSISKKNVYPAGLSVSQDGKFLYVAKNLGNSVDKIDTATGQVVVTQSVGKKPYTAFLSSDGKTVYVSNWGESSVTVLNADTLAVEKTISVGLHPNAIGENPADHKIYVSNSDSDQISVIDPKQQTVTQTISMAPYQGAPTGSSPDALTVSPDGKTLYVANAGNNDISVIDLQKGKLKGQIPTAWYPTGVFINGDELVVLNAKGLGTGPNKDGQKIGKMMNGTLSFIPVPDEGKLKRYTQQVSKNDIVYNTNGLGSLLKNGPIKHVIYIIKENRTYDQVFGDIKKGNGDSSLTMFGKNITPNLHKLANQFVLLDNFYTDAEVTAQGHSWATAADSNDYVEKNWPSNYSGRNRPYDFGITDQATPESGRLWNNAIRSGVSFRDYGEFTTTAPNSNLSVPIDPSIGNNYDPNFASFNLNISDVQREQEWANEYQQFEKNGNLPQLEIVRLGNDHTQGTKPGAPTPQALVAQNDEAVGKLVDEVSHSKYWKETAIFITEDDAQDGLDHVDAHRTESLVISPYTQTGNVDHTLYDTTSMLRTMELLLGMKPMTQFDASAMPMVNSFTIHPNFTPYSALEETYPLNGVNGQNAPAAEISQKMDFSKEDTDQSDTLTRVLWKATKGDQPYPKQN